MRGDVPQHVFNHRDALDLVDDSLFGACAVATAVAEGERGVGV